MTDNIFMLNNRNGESARLQKHGAILPSHRSLEKTENADPADQMPTGEWRGMMEHLAAAEKCTVVQMVQISLQISFERRFEGTGERHTHALGLIWYYPLIRVGKAGEYSSMPPSPPFR
jgi:hypothetical protein